MTIQTQNSQMAPLLKKLLAEASISENEFGVRMGLSDVEVASLLTGISDVKISMLPKLAQIFDMGVRDFFEPHNALPNSHRRTVSSSESCVNNQTGLRLMLSRWVNDYRFLEQKLNDKLPFKFGELQKAYVGTGKPRVDEDNYPEEFSPAGQQADKHLVDCLEPVANKARKVLGLTLDEPVPFDICHRLENAGVKVLLSTYKDFGIRGFAIAESDGGPALFVNSATLPKRSHYIFTLIHELGHLILTPDSGGLEVQKEGDRVPYDEAIANWFASLFIMPFGMFEKLWGSRVYQSENKLKEDIIDMQNKLNVNKNVIARRLLYMGIIDKQQRKCVIESFKQHGGAVPDSDSMLKNEDYPVRLKDIAGKAIENKIITRERAKEILSVVPWQYEDLFKCI